MGNQCDQRTIHYWDTLDRTNIVIFYSWAWHSEDWGDWKNKRVADWWTGRPRDWATRGLVGPTGLGGMLTAPLLLLVSLVPQLPPGPDLPRLPSPPSPNVSVVAESPSAHSAPTSLVITPGPSPTVSPLISPHIRLLPKSPSPLVTLVALVP